MSIVDGDRLRLPIGARVDAETEDHLVFTFEGLIRNTPFVAMMRELLGVLRTKLGAPVDIEFASDGKDFYLLQCRPQSYGSDVAPSQIPQDLAPERIVFSANRYVSNGRMPEITHIVYVDADAYAAAGRSGALREVGRAVGRLNKLLPRRQFILIGPGRWGSRGDIRLGVPVTYSDINNSAMLIEVAHKRGNVAARLVVRHAFLPGPGRSVDSVPAAVPRRPGRRVQPPLSERQPQHARRNSARIRAPGRHGEGDRRAARSRTAWCCAC